jgi:hypothetical protein
MRRLLCAATLVVVLFAGPVSADPVGPKDEMLYPPRPGDPCPPHPDSDTPPLPGEVRPEAGPTDTPWRYCLEEAPDQCECWPVGPIAQHAPEPGALALLVLGAVGLVVARRRQRADERKE